MILASAAPSHDHVEDQADVNSSGGVQPGGCTVHAEELCCASEENSYQCDEPQSWQPNLVLDCCPGECGASSSGLPCECLCCDQQLAASLPQSAQQIQSISQDVILYLADGIDAATSTVRPISRAYDGRQRHGPPLASASTLWFQRCLLLI
jgi:hypothetical protein